MMVHPHDQDDHAGNVPWDAEAEVEAHTTPKQEKVLQTGARIVKTFGLLTLLGVLVVIGVSATSLEVLRRPLTTGVVVVQTQTQPQTQTQTERNRKPATNTNDNTNTNTNNITIYTRASAMNMKFNTSTSTNSNSSSLPKLDMAQGPKSTPMSTSTSTSTTKSAPADAAVNAQPTPPPPPSSSSSSNDSNNDNLFQLTVPFYVYQDEYLDWINATETNKEKKVNMGIEELVGLTKYSKHSMDYWFAQHAKNHPLRTLNPEEAKLFFVPTLWNIYAEGKRPAPRNSSPKKPLCLMVTKTVVTHTDNNSNTTTTTTQEEKLCDKQLANAASRALEKSPWFQRYQGLDHIIVNSHWSGRIPADSPFDRCNQVCFENRLGHGFDPKQRIAIPSTYVGNPCPPTGGASDSNTKLHDFAMIGSMKSGFKLRQRLCQVLRQGHLDASVCGKGEQCPALAQAKFGFHVPGDTLGANRLMDTLLSNTVPIFTHPGQYDILPNFIPWKNLSYFIDFSNPKVSDQTLQKQLQTLLNTSSSSSNNDNNNNSNSYHATMERIQQHHYLLDHTQPYLFDAYMHQFYVKLRPRIDKLRATMATNHKKKSGQGQGHRNW